MLKRWTFITIICLTLLFIISVKDDAFAEGINVRVLILNNQQAVRISCPQGLVIKDAYSLKEVGKTPRETVLRVNQGRIFADGTDTGSRFVYAASDNVHNINHLNGAAYRGYFLVGLNDRGGLQVINYVALDDYIQGVLGGEIIASWPVEAIKAQAVAVRTYVMYKLGESRSRLYDVVNDTGDQMYIGVRGEAPNFTRAVKETSNQVMAREGKAVCAYYHSSCGGGTSDSIHVFSNDQGSLQGSQCNFCRGNPNSTWGKTLTAEVIRHRLNNNGFRTGRIFSITPISRSENKRIIYLEIKHELGVSHLFASDFRRMMGYQEIKSTKFDVHPKQYVTYRQTKQMAASRGLSMGGTDAAGTITNENLEIQIPTYYYFSGAGWGHGVGMCQWGARGMALEGYDYKQIVRHYYPNTELSVITVNE